MEPARWKKQTADLPAPVAESLKALLDSAQASFGDDLRSVVLFGSAAEGKLRATSDVNLMFVLKRFDKERVDGIRESLRVASVAARVVVMFIMESELSLASEVSSVKFWDIAQRHRLLLGEDLLASISVTRQSRIQALRQILLNVTIRLRERYAILSLREEQLAVVVAETAGPLRTAAFSLLELEGHKANSPKEALNTIALEIGGQALRQAMDLVSTARETRAMPAGTAAATLFQLMDVAQEMRARIERLG